MDRWSFVSDGKRYSAMQRDNHGGEYYRCEDADQQIGIMQASINALTAEASEAISRETQTLSKRLQDVQECLRWMLEYNDTRSRRIAFKVLFDGFTRQEAVAEIDGTPHREHLESERNMSEATQAGERLLTPANESE